MPGSEVHPIKIDELGDLGVDHKGHLYWKNRPGCC